MAADPSFSSTVNNAVGYISVVETNVSVPTQAVAVLTAGASGTKIEEIVIHPVSGSLVASTVLGVVYLYLYDGSTYHLFDTAQITALTASATVAPFRWSKTYPNLWLKTGWSLRASTSTSSNLLKVHAFGADF